MKKFKHIITCILAIVISICLLTTSVSAAWINDAGHWYVNSGYAQMVVGGVLNYIGAVAGTAAGSIVLPGGGTISGTFIGKALGNCAALGIYKLADYYAQGYTDDDFLGGEAAAIGGMDRTTATGKITTSGYMGTSLTGTYWRHALSTLKNANFPFFSFLRQCGIADKVMIIGCLNSSLMGFYFNEYGILYRGVFTNPYGAEHATYCTMYEFEDLELLKSEICFTYSSGYLVFYDRNSALSYPSFLTSSLYCIDWNSCDNYFTSDSSQYFAVSGYFKDSKNVDFSSALTSFNAYCAPSSTNGTLTWYSGCHYMDTFTLDSSLTLEQPTGTDPASRPSSLMQAIHNYNVDNSYTDNSTTVNYFLAPKDQTPTADNVVSPAIFDEETWVFTEPATGAQYQSTGWTYDYNTRTYDIDLEAGTFTLDGTDVTRIVSQYGNELATITYYDASGNALATDEYNYVMMAASECALNGHTYNANTTKEPTCIAAGERTYTCSACGDQYVEEIAKTDHVYADHTITQEPTCTVGGISSKTCSTCGDQITEKLDPLGHDFIAKEITETTYELPPGTSCPSCSGTTYTFSRQGVIYTLLCSECNIEWTAEADVTYGSTTYVCSNCGESKIEGDATEETQETWFTKFIYKFKWLSSIGQIYRQLVADITSDAETAAAIADGTVMLDEVTTGHAELGGGSAGSEGSGRQYTAPELAVSFGNSNHYGVDWDAIKPLNLSWYAPHKETVDGIVSGILWLGFLFLLIKRAPSIIQGAEMVTEDRMKIDNWNSDSGSVSGLIRKYRTSRNSFYRR